MSDMDSILQQFELIEKKVEDVVQVRKQLQQENEELHRKIGKFEHLIQEKNEAEKKHEELTALVRAKIDSLIGRLEGVTENR